uniref:Uncharacterized protein n=1 Tax=Rhizophora mucronata TaxID=61149 RepID=A0A2P2NW66_RHIMU
MTRDAQKSPSLMPP